MDISDYINIVAVIFAPVISAMMETNPDQTSFSNG